MLLQTNEHARNCLAQTRSHNIYLSNELLCPSVLNYHAEIDSDVTTAFGEVQKVETQKQRLEWVMISIKNCNFFAHGALRECVCALQIELEFGNVGFQGEGKTWVPGEKPLRVWERTNKKLNPHMASTWGFELGAHWWEARALCNLTLLIRGLFCPSLIFALRMRTCNTVNLHLWSPLTINYLSKNTKIFPVWA